MTFLIECRSPSRSYRWMLRPGDRARVGASPWVEYRIVDDGSLSETHFAFDYRLAPKVESIEPSEIKVDGVTVHEMQLHSSIRIQASQCYFDISPCPFAPTLGLIHQPSESLEKRSDGDWIDKEEVLLLLELSDVGKPIVKESVRAADAIVRLRTQGQMLDACKILAGVLSQRDAIHWCFHAIPQSHCPPVDEALEAVTRWLDSPGESMRAQVESTCCKLDVRDPWKWMLSAIQWTGGSLSPDGEVPIPPPRKMVVNSILSALQLAYAMCQLPDFRVRCIDTGLAYLHRKSKD